MQNQLDKGEKNRCPTNMRPLRILEAFIDQPKALTATEINKRVNLPKQTIHRLIKSMVDAGYLIYDKNSKKLRPARRSRAMAMGCISASHWPILRHQILTDLARETGETVNFVLPESEGMRYIDRVDTDWPFRIQLPIGTNVPFHCTASGKVFLSHLKKSAQKAFVDNLSLTAETVNTITDRSELSAELKKIKGQGHAIDGEEFMMNMFAFAVPILGDKGQYIASLAVHGPKQRMIAYNGDDIVQLLKTHADRLSHAFQEMM